MLSTPSLKNFIYRSWLALPVCFRLWYVSASVWTWPLAKLTHATLLLIVPKLIAAVEHSGHILDIITNLGDLKVYTEQKQMAAFVFNINPLIYAFSLASVFGISCDAIKSIAFDLAPAGMSYLTGFSALQLNLLGVAYQFGYLVLPTLTPLALWLCFNPDFLQ